MIAKRMIFSIAITLIAAAGLSSCVYHTRGPAYDYGYGYRYRVSPPPPRRVVVVPAPQPRVIYKDRGRSRHANSGRSNRNYDRAYRRY